MTADWPLDDRDEGSVAATSEEGAHVAGPVPSPGSPGVGRFGAAVSATFATNAALAVVGIATGVMAARLLGPNGEGQLAAIQTWPLLLGALAMLGLPEALVFYIATEPERGLQLTSTAVIVALGSAVIVGGVGWPLMPTLLSSQDGAVIAAARVFLIIGVIDALTGIPHGALRGARQFRAWNLFRIAPGLAWLTILCVAWVMNRAGPVPLSRWFLAGLAAVGLPFWLVVARRLSGPLRPRIADATPLLRFGLPSVLTTVPQTINLRLDQLLIVALLPARYLGLYVVAVAWAGGIAPVLSAVGSVLFPHLSAEPDSRRKVALLAPALQGGLLAALALAVIFTAAAPFGIPFVFGGRFDGAVAPALVLVPAGGVLAWAGVAEEGLRGFARPGSVLWAEVVGAVVTVATLPPLLELLGILGAALASLLGYLTVAGTCAMFLARSTGIGPVSLVRPTLAGWIAILDTIRAMVRSGRTHVGRR